MTQHPDLRRRSIPRQTVARKKVLDLVTLVTGVLEDGKAENVIDIDLAGKTSFADRMVICSGQSNRQVLSMADRLVEALKESGHQVTGVEGRDSADWVLVDLGDIIVHIFHADVRELYNLEKMWSLPLLAPMEARA